MGALPKKHVTQDAAPDTLKASASGAEAKLDALSAKLDLYHAANSRNFAEVNRKLDLLMAHLGVTDDKQS